MTYPEQWSTDPAENTKTPPLGAPEFGLPHDKTSDCVRVLMAGVRECWDRVGTLGLQAKDNVDIVGGKIGKNVVIDAEALPAVGLAEDSKKLGGKLPAAVLQDAYDACWPIGSLRWLEPATNPNILIPGGIIATWEEVTSLADRIVAVAGPGRGDTWGSGLAIGVTVTPTALTIAQMPLHGHPTRISTAAGTADAVGGLMLDDDNLANYAGYTGAPDNDPGQQVGGTGGGQTHNHTATASTPAGCSLRLLKRIA
jgi:hypothetical protein